MKAFLINPPSGLFVREDRCQSAVGDFTVSVVRPPMDLMFMASSLESLDISCRIKDYPIEGGDWESFKDDFTKFMPDILIISVTTPTIEKDLHAVRLAKKIVKNLLTIAKGAHFLEEDQRVLASCKELDVIVRGESELVVKELLSSSDWSAIQGITYRVNERIVRNPARELLENLDALPLPARRLVKNHLYPRPDTAEPMAVIETSRGCPGDCIFCLVGQVSGKKIRLRSVSGIVDEVEGCIREFGIRNFHFKSDTFTWKKEWVIELCQEICRRGIKIQWLCNSRVDTLDRQRLEFMKKAGCWAIGLGVESGNQDILDNIHKGITLAQAQEAVSLCREFGILSYVYFIIGFPWDNKETIEDSVRFALKLDPDFVDFFLPFPFPGTGLEKIAREQGLFDGQMPVAAYSQAGLRTASLTREELMALKKSALARFYLRPGYILKKFAGAASWRVRRNYFYHGLKALRRMR
ncbi:MAG: B12-binding domain-containing radical SAM protein [Candidatus Omnitrophica bacterium]|nr:B12-binding domain-containing radical SAM protein [Candidatus Omnitrophota bacterium]